MNNYERIKQMSIDEMAQSLSNTACNLCVYIDVNCEGKRCKDSIKQWLQAESE